MVFNATFNNISAISWGSDLLVGESGGPGENYWPVIRKFDNKDKKKLRASIWIDHSRNVQCVLNVISMCLFHSRNVFWYDMILFFTRGNVCAITLWHKEKHKLFSSVPKYNRHYLVDIMFLIWPHYQWDWCWFSLFSSFLLS